jgi:hypothetical protein
MNMERTPTGLLNKQEDENMRRVGKFFIIAGPDSKYGFRHEFASLEEARESTDDWQSLFAESLDSITEETYWNASDQGQGKCPHCCGWESQGDCSFWNTWVCENEEEEYC